MSEQSDKDGFIVCYPKAARGTWNAGPCCGLSKKIDDVNFIKELISKLQNEYKIDASRIYVAGVSNGGMLAYRLGQELSSKVAAIAAVEGCMYQRLEGTQPVSVIAFNGTNDPVIPYDGGTGRWFGLKLKIPGIKDTIKFWTERNSCDPQPITESNGNVVKETYTKGAAGTEVCLYTLKGVGHVWPGGRRAHLTGNGTEKDISATELISKFFLSHPKQGAESPES